jgi:AcrR family transcriptional regulator
MTRRGPRAGTSDTREAILGAARATFAEAGYEAATIRRIAAAAKVDPALIHHYFGSKEDLFAAAVHLPLAPEQVVEEVFAAGIDGAATRLATVFLRVWETPQTREALIGQMRMALSTGQPPPLRDFLAASLFRRAAQHLTGPDRDLRIQLVAAHLVGVAIVRYVIELEPLASMPVEKIVAAMAPRLQGYLSGKG